MTSGTTSGVDHGDPIAVGELSRRTGVSTAAINYYVNIGLLPRPVKNGTDQGPLLHCARPTHRAHQGIEGARPAPQGDQKGPEQRRPRIRVGRVAAERLLDATPSGSRSGRTGFKRPAVEGIGADRRPCQSPHEGRTAQPAASAEWPGRHVRPPRPGGGARMCLPVASRRRPGDAGATC